MKQLKCPECGEIMLEGTKLPSLNGIATYYNYYCETCGGMFKVKRLNAEVLK